MGGVCVGRKTGRHITAGLFLTAGLFRRSVRLNEDGIQDRTGPVLPVRGFIVEHVAVLAQRLVGPGLVDLRMGVYWGNLGVPAPLVVDGDEAMGSRQSHHAVSVREEALPRDKAGRDIDREVHFQIDPPPGLHGRL
jgi:hypothetical protein